MPSCAFCNLSSQRKKEDHRCLDDSAHHYVILDKSPKVKGHTLVISKKHYPDVTRLDAVESRRLLAAVIRWSKTLQVKPGCEKVYLMSMCDHWDPSERSLQSPETTEHLHMQLFPRYKEDRAWRGEVYFCRPPRQVTRNELRRTKERLLS